MEFFLFLLLLGFSVLVIVTLARLSSLSSRLDEVTFDLKMMKGRLDQLERETGPAPGSMYAPGETAAMEPRVSQTPPLTAAPAGSPPTTPSPTPPPPVIEPAAPPPPPSKSKEEWEALIGGRLLNRIGALALIIGVGFFLKYAFDRNWITEWARVLIGASTGLLLLAGAARSRTRGLTIFSQGLVGAGIAILYLSAYASFNYYSLVSQPVAFVLMGLVTLIAFLQAFAYDSLAVSLLGWLGGFLTPFLLSTGEANAPGLFTYIALLDAGILAVLLLRPRWTVLEPLTLAATYAVYFLWHGDAYTAGHLPVAVFFISVFWLLFHGLDLARALFGDETPNTVHRLVGGANALAASIGLYLVIDPGHHVWTGSVAALLAALYALSALAVSRRRSDRGVVAVQYAVTAMVLAVLAAEIHFEDLTVIVVYALEVMALAWIGLRWDLRHVRIGAVAVLAWAVTVLLVTRGALVWPEPSALTIVFNRRSAAYLALIAAAAAVLVCARRSPRGVPARVAPAMHSLWVFLAFLLITTEINDLFRSLIQAAATADEATLRFQQGLAISGAWSCFAIPLTWTGERLDVRPLRVAGIIVSCLAALQICSIGWQFAPIERFLPVVNLRFALFALVGGTALWQALWLRRKDRFTFGPWLHLPWIAVWFTCCTVETVDLFRRLLLHAPEDGREELVFLRVMALAGVWALAGLPLIRAGSRSGNRVVHDSGLVYVLLGTALALARGIAYDPVIALVSLLNGRAAVLVVVLLALAATLALLRRGSHPWTETLVLATRLLVIAATLVLITGEIRDVFEREIALLTEADGDRIHHLRNMQQMLLSTAWLLYSILLMGYGLWKRARALRIAAIVLFGVAILKIFIYDLSFLDTLYRIVSFIGLGVILLAVSYLYQRYRGVIFDTGD